MRLFCIAALLSSNVCSTRGYEWKIIGEKLEPSLKNEWQSHILEEIFQPKESKSLTLS